METLTFNTVKVNFLKMTIVSFIWKYLKLKYGKTRSSKKRPVVAASINEWRNDDIYGFTSDLSHLPHFYEEIVDGKDSIPRKPHAYDLPHGKPASLTNIIEPYEVVNILYLDHPDVHSDNAQNWKPSNVLNIEPRISSFSSEAAMRSSHPRSGVFSYHQRVKPVMLVGFPNDILHSTGFNMRSGTDQFNTAIRPKPVPPLRTSSKFITMHEQLFDLHNKVVVQFGEHY